MEEKYYTRSNGERVKIKDMNTTHLLNSLNKKYVEIFNSNNKEEFNNKLNEINDLKEDYYRRLNEFSDKLGE